MGYIPNLQVKALRVGTEVYKKAVDGLSSADYEANVAYRAKKVGEVLGLTTGNSKPGNAGEFLQIVVAIPDNPLSPLTSNFTYYYFWVDSTDVDFGEAVVTGGTSGGTSGGTTSGTGTIPGDTQVVIDKPATGSAGSGGYDTTGAERVEVGKDGKATVKTADGKTIVLQLPTSDSGGFTLPGWVKWAAFSLIAVAVVGIIVVAVTGRKRSKK